MEIQAAIARDPHGSLAIEDVELEEPRADEVVVRIAASGICHADVLARDQDFPVPLPAILGHEGVGTVEAIGDAVDGVLPGDRVVMTFSSCGRCEPCRRGRPPYCLDLFDLNFRAARPDGTSAYRGAGGGIHGHFFGQSSFATHSVVPAANVVVLEADAPLALYAPLGCGVQTGAGAVINSLAVPAGSGLAVFGAGAVGLSAVMAARAVGATRIVAVDIHPNRLRLAQELGATDVLHSRETPRLADAIRELTDGIGIPYAIDTTGVPDVIREAADALMITGTLGLIGAGPLGTEVHLDLVRLVHGLTVRGILQGDSVPHLFVPQLIDLHRNGRLPLEKLVTTFAFEEIDTAIEATIRGEVLKAVLVMEDASPPTLQGAAG